MKNKILLAILAIALVLGMTACKDSGGGTGTAPAITTASLPGGTVGTVYSQTLAATGDAPITWSKENGDLPGGLTLSSAGVISGTPTAAGAFTFTVKAANAAGSGTKQLSITIVLPYAPYIGTWFLHLESYDTTITITETHFDLTRNTTGYLRFDITSWTPVTVASGTNTYPTTSSVLSDFPSGFTLGVSNVSYAVYGDPGSSLTVYLHSDGDKIKLWFSSINDPYANIYVRQ
jgi:hypothetical protein